MNDAYGLADVLAVMVAGKGATDDPADADVVGTATTGGTGGAAGGLLIEPASSDLLVARDESLRSVDVDVHASAIDQIFVFFAGTADVGGVSLVLVLSCACGGAGDDGLFSCFTLLLAASCCCRCCCTNLCCCSNCI